MKDFKAGLGRVFGGCVAGLIMTLGGMLLPVVSGTYTQGVAYAQEGGSKPAQKTRKTPALREKVFKALGDAQAKMEAGEYAAALQMLNDLKADPALNSYEKAMTWNFIAYVYSNQENYPQALSSFKQVLAQPEIPEALETQTLYSMAQLYLATDQFKESIATFRKWFALTTNPAPTAHVLYAQALFQTDDFKGAVTEVEKAMAIARRTGEQPRELWLQILRAGYMELNNQVKTIETLELLVKLYPKAEYFSHLSSLYGDKGDEKRQVLVLEAGYDGGYLNKQHQLLALASLLLNSDVPYKAAKILTEGMQNNIIEESVSNLRILAQAWMFAQEPRESIKVLQKAAKKSDDGELYVRLGQSYADLDEWENCVNAIRSGLKKGGIARNDSANVTLGVCLFNKDDLDEAIKAFELARRDERSRQFSDQWISFLRVEKDRRQRIAHSLI